MIASALHNGKEKVVKNVSVDSFVRSLMALLQVILLAISGWMLSQILTQGDRITRIETRYESVLASLATLSSMAERQAEVLRLLTELKTEVVRIKSDIASIEAKVK